MMRTLRPAGRPALPRRLQDQPRTRPQDLETIRAAYREQFGQEFR